MFDDEWCSDSLSKDKFIIKDGDGMKGCGWLRQKEERINRHCGRSDVRVACLVTCNACKCADTLSNFTIMDGDGMKGCVWLREKLVRQVRHCDRTDVKMACPVTCRVCVEEVSTASPTSVPTPIPS